MDEHQATVFRRHLALRRKVLAKLRGEPDVAYRVSKIEANIAVVALNMFADSRRIPFNDIEEIWLPDYRIGGSLHEMERQSDQKEREERRRGFTYRDFSVDESRPTSTASTYAWTPVITRNSSS